MSNILRPQDVVVLLKLISIDGQHWSYSSLSSSLGISASEIHAGIKRATSAKLFSKSRNRPVTNSLVEFIIHGVKYAYPPTRGGRTRGMLTGYSAPPLVGLVRGASDVPPVWPYSRGRDTGFEFSPLYKTVPQAAEIDLKLYEMLALVDALRDGRARERSLAVAEIRKRIDAR